jgi:peptidoglycan/LPS O-acetylase OafA/YrhL
MSCSIYALLSPPADPVLSVYTSPLHLLFAFGMIAMLDRALQGRCLLRTHSCCPWAGWVYCYVCLLRTWRPPSGPWRTISYGVSATLCALGLMELERSGELVVPQTLISFLGDASYSIYLVHQPALSLMAKLWLSSLASNEGSAHCSLYANGSRICRARCTCPFVPRAATADAGSHVQRTVSGPRLSLPEVVFALHASLLHFGPRKFRNPR